MTVKAAGFITLHRQILDWEWYGDTNTFRVFVHLLLNANYTDGRFEGRVIHRGQLVTSLTSLAAGTSLSIRQVRVSLEHLQMTGEVTSESNNRYRVITIVKYDDYQSPDRQNDRQMTNELTSKRQADDRQMTGEAAVKRQQYNNNNNNNKETKEQNKSSLRSESVSQTFLTFWIEYPKKVARQAAEKAWAKLKPDADLMEKIMSGLYRWKNSGQWTREDGRFIPHAATWLNGRRWEDEVKKEAPAPTYSPVKQVVAQQYSQRDYVEDQEDAMNRMLEDMRRSGF
jgi:hypothetical protein